MRVEDPWYYYTKHGLIQTHLPVGFSRLTISECFLAFASWSGVWPACSRHTLITVHKNSTELLICTDCLHINKLIENNSLPHGKMHTHTYTIIILRHSLFLQQFTKTCFSYSSYCTNQPIKWPIQFHSNITHVQRDYEDGHCSNVKIGNKLPCTNCVYQQI